MQTEKQYFAIIIYLFISHPIILTNNFDILYQVNQT